MSEDWQAKVKWADGFKMIASDYRKHSIVIDVPEEVGSKNVGIAPGRLLLISLGACTAMDIVLLLKKFRQELTSLEVFVRGEQKTEDYPHYFDKILLRYVIKGRKLNEEQVKRAIKLSIERYCSVGATISRRVEIKTSHEIVQE